MTSDIRGADDSSRGARGRRRGNVRFLRDLLIILLAAILVSFLIKTFLVRSFYIPSPSMTNTLQIDDRVVVNELVPKVSSLKRGDVIVFTDPGGWLPTSAPNAAGDPNPVVHGVQTLLTAVGFGTQDSDNHLIKRVIGLPGDKITCCNDLGQIVVNGVPIKEPYIKVPRSKRADAFTYSVTVPAGHLWVLGDNRYDSDDSAAHNFKNDAPPFVPVADVVGRAFVITWPTSRWSALSDYPDVFRGTGVR